MFTSSLELTYGISTNPNPIQVSSDNSPRIVGIDIVFSNNSSSPINLQKLDIEIPVGDNAQELTADAAIQYKVTPNGTPQSPIWDISLNDGTVSLTPYTTEKPVSITKDGFAIQLSDIKVNEELGTCYLGLTETTGTTDKDKKVNAGQFQCGKFPPTFSWSNFEAVDNAGAVISKPVNPGTSIWLAWEANVIPNATLSLHYDQQVIDVTTYHASGSNQYRYPSDTTGIQINNEDITFTLQANYTMLDGTVLQPTYRHTISVFSLSNFKAVDKAGAVISKPVNPETSIWLTWETNVISNATLSLHYDQQVIDVTTYHASGSNQYRYPSDTTGIQINNDNKTFTLQANYKMPNDIVLSSVYQYTVSVIEPARIRNFTITNKRSPDNIIWLGEEVTIQWITNDATDYCDLYRNNELICGRVLKHSHSFHDTPTFKPKYVLKAYNKSGVEDDSREYITVKVYQWKNWRSIPTSYPSDVVITPDGAYTYVTSATVEQSKFMLMHNKILINHLYVINNTTGTIENTIPLNMTNNSTDSHGFTLGLAIIPKRNTVLVASTTLTIIPPVQQPRLEYYFVNLSDSQNPKGFLISQVHGFERIEPQTLNKSDILNNYTILPSNSGPKPWDIAITSNGKYAYLTNAGANNVIPLDISQNKVLGTIPVGQFPSGIVIDSDDKYAYVTNMGDDSVSVIDIFKNTVLTLKLKKGSKPTGIAIARSNNQEFVYITNTGADSVSVIGVSKNVVSPNPIKVGMSPIDIAITSDNQYAFVTNFGSHDVSMIDIQTNTVIDIQPKIKVGKSPTSIAITPDNKRIYVINAGSHSVSVLEKTEISAPETVLFAFKSKPTDKDIKKLQQWLGSIADKGNWQVERIANALLIKFNSKDKNQVLEKKYVNTLFCSLKNLPDWDAVDKAEQEDSNLTIYCKGNNVEQYEQVLGEILGIHQPPQTRFCAVS